MQAEHGNEYALEVLDNGVVTFRHLHTGEILHGSVGPEKEAKELYISASGLAASSMEKVIVFDVGTGCGAQLLALLDFLATETPVKEIEVYSFDLEKNGLRAAQNARGQFASVERHIAFLEKTTREDAFQWVPAEGKKLSWQFVQGDFRDTVVTLAQRNPELKADYIFYDFFSPASYPWLWTLDLFEKLHAYCQPTTRLITYSSATCVKAVLAAAGWFVGTTIPSGKKSASICAGGSLEVLTHPLSAKFHATFTLSHKPFCDAETEEGKEKIRARLAVHPQFREKP